MPLDLSKIKIIVFDIGATLMEFKNMPPNWSDFYSEAFEKVKDDFSLNLTDEDISLSVSLLKSLNPRITKCETEIYPRALFEKVTAHWRAPVDSDMLISHFFDGLNLSARVYDYTFSLLTALKKAGKTVGLLTDLPNGMPDDYFKKYVSDILSKCDFYISSQTFGYRKPNPYSLTRIAKQYGVCNDEILYVGDEQKDAQTAERFGCAFMFIENFEKIMHPENH